MEDGAPLTKREAREFSDIVKNFYQVDENQFVPPAMSPLEIALMSGAKETLRFLGRAILDVFSIKR